MEKIKRYLKPIIFIFILIICLVFIFYYNYSKVESEEVVKEESNDLVVEEEKEEDEEKEEEIYYYIDIKGAVNNPGVYKVQQGARVIDAINAASGLTEYADTSNINLSKKVVDEMFIIIYTKEEIEEYKKDTISTSEINKKIVENYVLIDEDNDAQITSDTSNDSSYTTSIININSATKEQLTTLSGIGDSKAEAIISYREENGNFESIEDIKNVSGIGDALFEKIKEYITV